MQEFTQRLRGHVLDCKKELERVKAEKLQQQLKNEEEAKKRAAELREKAIMGIIGDLPQKLWEAAKKGSNWIDIELKKDDFHFYTTNPVKNTPASYTYEYLKNIPGLTVDIKCKQEEDRGAYNERILWDTYFLRIMF